MKQPYLEVTFRHGKPLAAYYYLHRREGDRCVRTERREAGMIVDYAPDGRAIGIELTAPGKVTLAALNRVLAAVHSESATVEDLAPLMADN